MNEAEKTEIAMRYATEWYTYHAGQRMTAVRFYLITIGALFYGYVRVPEWALGIATLAFLVSAVFLVLDIRNTELVNCGRAALDQLEPSLGLSIRAEDRKRLHLGEAMRVLKRDDAGLLRSIVTFQLWLRVLYYAVLLLSVVLAITSLWWHPMNNVPAVRTDSPSSEVRAVRGLIEEYLIARKQDTSEAVLTAQGAMVESEILAGLRSCRLGLGADPLCDRYEVWTDRALASLRPLRTASVDRAKAALQSFADTYARDLRAELGELESQFSRRALGSLSRPGPVASEGQLGAKGE